MKRFLLIILLLVFGVTLNGEEIHLTLEKVKEIAVNNNPVLLAEKESKKAAHADALKSIFGMLPSAALNGKYTFFDSERTVSYGEVPESEAANNSKSYGLNVSFQIFNGGKNYLNLGIKNIEARIADLKYDSELLSTISDAESKYFSLLENSELLEIAKKDLEASERHLKTAEIRYKSGTLSKADYLKMQSEKASKEVSLIQTQSLHQISRLDLANFLQISQDYTTEPMSFGEYEGYLEKLQGLSLDNVESLIDKVISIGVDNNPSLEAASLSVDASKKAVQVAAGEFLPTVSLSYSKSWEKYDIEDEFDSQGGAVSLSLSLPIFPIADNAANLSKIKYDLKQSEFSYQSAKNEIQMELESSLLKLISSAKSVNSSNIALEYAGETFYQMEERFKNNVVTATDMLDAEVLLTTSRNQYTTSIYDFLRAKSSLMQQMGVEDENTLWSLITID